MQPWTRNRKKGHFTWSGQRRAGAHWRCSRRKTGSCSFSSSLFLLLKEILLALCLEFLVHREVCTKPSKGWRQRCCSSSALSLKGSLCGTAVAWLFQKGQVWNHCSSFILCVIFPDKENVAGKYLSSCMFGDWGLSLHLPPRLPCLPATNESRKAVVWAVTWPIGRLSTCLALAHTVSEWASNALQKHTLVI